MYYILQVYFDFGVWVVSSKLKSIPTELLEAFQQLPSEVAEQIYSFFIIRFPLPIKANF
jgi:ABC-type spermidine/putrescine transport system permease subunit I